MNDTKSVVLLRAPGYKTKPYEQRVNYPADCTLHYDQNQGVLQIKLPSGEPLAGFRCSAFCVEKLVEIGEPTIIEQPWLMQ